MASLVFLARSREAGQTLPLVLLLVALTVAGALLLGALGQRAVEAARARTAADAAALAGAAAGEPEARAAAMANGAELLAFASAGGEAEVDVRVGGATATARARHEPSAVQADGPGDVTGLHPDLVAALARAERLLGRPVPITSGFRSRADQERLWAERHQNPFPVARPGTSRHERGLAVDVPRSFVPTLRGVAHAVGLCFPLPVTDPVHFELCPGAGR